MTLGGSFDVRFYLVAIAFLVFDVELLLLIPVGCCRRSYTAAGEPARGIDRAVELGLVESRGLVFAEVMVFMAAHLGLGLVYACAQGVFRWR